MPTPPLALPTDLHALTPTPAPASAAPASQAPVPDSTVLSFLSRHLLDEQLALALVQSLNPREATHEQWLGMVALCKGREADILGSRSFWATVFPDEMDYPELNERLTQVQSADALWQPYRGLFWRSMRGLPPTLILKGEKPSATSLDATPILAEAWERASATVLSSAWNQTLVEQPAREIDVSFLENPLPLSIDEHGVLDSFTRGSQAQRRVEHYTEAMDCLLFTLETIADLDPLKEVLHRRAAQMSVDCLEPFCAALPHESPRTMLSPRFDRAMACLLRARTFGADVHAPEVQAHMRRLFGNTLRGVSGTEFARLNFPAQTKILKAAAASKAVSAREARVSFSRTRPDGHNFAGSIYPAFTDPQVWSWRQQLLGEASAEEWQGALKGWERKTNDPMELSQALRSGVMPVDMAEALLHTLDPKSALNDETRSILEAYLLWVSIEPRVSPSVATGEPQSSTTEQTQTSTRSSSTARALRI